MNSPAIAIQNLYFSRGLNSILQDVNVAIHPGEYIGIFGPNGGGKTTLLKLLMGFIEPIDGAIRIFGQPPHKERHRIGYVPQAHRIDPDFPITLEELVLLGCKPKRLFFERFNKQEKDALGYWMDQLRLEKHKSQAYGKLSGGLAQRALLARALISNPDIILLDEPTANIDAESLAIFFDTLEQLKGKKTILLVTHDLRTLTKQANRLLYVQGTISSVAPAEVCGHFALGLYHAPLDARKTDSRFAGAER